MELKNNMLKEAASMLKCNEKDIAKRIAAQAHELKEKDKEIAELKAKLVQGAEDDILKDKVEINGVELVTAELKDVDGLLIKKSNFLFNYHKLFQLIIYYQLINYLLSTN